MQEEMRILIDDRPDPGWGAKFLALLLAIPLAGLLGLPLLVILLILLLCNPGNLGERLAQCQCLKIIPGFRSGQRVNMAVVSLLYLLPLSTLGLIVIGVDSMLWGILP